LAHSLRPCSEVALIFGRAALGSLPDSARSTVEDDACGASTAIPFYDELVGREI
jgi:hypothetical protein